MKDEMMMSQSAFSRSSKMKRLRLISVAAVLLAVCLAFVGGAAGAVEVSNFDSLKNAVNNGESEIVLTNDVQINEMLTIPNGKKITISGNRQMTYGDGYTETWFSVPASSELVISGITIFGNNSWDWVNESTKWDYTAYYTPRDDQYYPNTIRYLKDYSGTQYTQSVFLISGNLSFIDNTKIQNFFAYEPNNKQYSYTPLLKVTGTVDNKAGILLEDVTISKCACLFLKSQYANFEMKSGTIITDNYDLGEDGGFFDFSYTQGVINGGDITLNLGGSRGGFFGLTDGTILTMNGGKIADNMEKNPGSNTAGSMIHLRGNAKFTMNGGEIVNNTAYRGSAIVSRWTTDAAEVILNGGKISDNKAMSPQFDNPAVFLRSKSTIGENMVVHGNVVVDSLNAALTNKGTITGNLIVRDSTSSVENKGTINGDVILKNGKFKNFGTITGDIDVNGGEFICIQDHTITFDTRGGNPVPSIIEKCRNAVSIPENPSRYGYTFKEWNPEIPATMPAKDMTVIAQWVANTSTVTFNAGEGTVSETLRTVTFDQPYGELPTPTRDGYEFVGWYLNDKPITADTKVTVDGDHTLTAEWKEITTPPTSSGGSGISGYSTFPRVTENGGLVDFGASKVITGVILPEGSSGSVILKVDTIEGWTNILETEYTFDISVQTMGDGMAYILFEIPLRTLENLGITPADVCAYHFVDGEWVMLKTTYEVKEGTVFYEAETDSFSPFKLVFEEGAATPKEAETEPVIPPTEEPDVPDEPETLPPIDEPVDEPETPAPLLAVLAGLGAAVVLRRK